MKYTEKGTLILDGKLVAQEIQNTIKKTIDDSNVEITLATVLVGEDKPSKLYVNTFINYEKKIDSDLIEIHNRPNYINLLKNKLSKKIILYFHNDPLSMNGSKKVTERINLLNNIDKLIFNSEWSRARFFVNIKNDTLYKKTSVCY